MVCFFCPPLPLSSHIPCHSSLHSTTDRTYTPFTKQARYTLTAPQVTSFSSQGPLVDPSNSTAGVLTNDILKPDIMGPGNQLWGAWRAIRPGRDVKQQFDKISGTSMATPHLAGMTWRLPRHYGLLRSPREGLRGAMSGELSGEVEWVLLLVRAQGEYSLSEYYSGMECLAAYVILVSPLICRCSSTCSTSPPTASPHVQVCHSHALVCSTISLFLVSSSFHLLLPPSLCAGIAALLMQQYPSWSPAQVKSAIMTTSGVLNKAGMPIRDDYGGTATPWMMGSGQVDGTRLLDPGLTFDTSYSDYVSFLVGQDPGKGRSVFGAVTGIKGYELNQPNIVVSLLSGTAVVTRTVTNAGAAAATYQASVTPPSGADVAVQPTSLTLSPGQSGSFTVTISMTGKSKGFTFGSLVWRDGQGHAVRCVLGVQGT